MISKDTERWRPVEGFPRHWVSSEGRVYSESVGLIEQRRDRCGYETVDLMESKTRLMNKRVHRLVADAFLESPNAALTLRHVNGDKTDNRAENLEWVKVTDNEERNTAPPSRRERLLEVAERFLFR